MDKTRRCRAALHCAAAQSRPVGIEARPEDDLTGSGEGQASKTGSQRRRAGAGCRRGRATGGTRQRDGRHPLQVRHPSQSDPWDREAGKKRAGNASVTVCFCRAGAHCCMNARAGWAHGAGRSTWLACVAADFSHTGLWIWCALCERPAAMLHPPRSAHCRLVTAHRWSLRTSSEVKHAELTTRYNAAKVCPIASSRNTRVACATLIVGNLIQIFWFQMSTCLKNIHTKS